MYKCIVCLDNNSSEVFNLLYSKLIHSKRIIGRTVELKTQKLWKLLYFGFRLRNSNYKFEYIVLFDSRKGIKIPAFIKEYTIEEYEHSFTQKITIPFSNVFDILKIRISLFLKN